ncbi:nicotinamide-nucleotide amidohydrolase family protein [Brachybacterium muris]|uniref:Competence protein n=1 Tax=Brachybacterium muris UCD-AY4 TaxID=1249481 RepID=A0A022KWL5_9MICO|nr:nicotinamide-nucleotide amidohydrolase family protein [Brachybacterium muris]EYT50199.1 competence protein [Brachybacterium muris UCD-AY4]MBM7499950.1 nicotinamide-nucleotide amidase [Brachybacterium muris]MCT1997001.1 nicotinamide-nucleotide amidohydrolase family protein [Brachybacterium muris]MCT2177681.1 nicotinamide-nucleotide amidohydrolase family protein [Brachybacterium muris]MCT2261017.1 nicotinamide-nucleotide amidohydrolase family protein [Brachybacterium muris]
MAAERPDPAPVIAAAAARELTIATAESLTAGALVARLVDVPGSSAVVAGGAACYSYTAKERVLGVDASLLETDGAVSAEVALQMAAGARALYAADLAVATTGVAGPGPDARGVPAGTVFLAVDRAGEEPVVQQLQLTGSRSDVRVATVDAAVELLLRALGEAGRR